MNNYLNQSIYTCKDPRLLITDVATTPEQYYVTRLKKTVQAKEFFAISLTSELLLSLGAESVKVAVN